MPDGFSGSHKLYCRGLGSPGDAFHDDVADRCLAGTICSMRVGILCRKNLIHIDQALHRNIPKVRDSSGHAFRLKELEYCQSFL